MKAVRCIGKAVLIMVVFFLFGSGNVLAQTNSVQTLWTTTFTVGSFTDNNGIFGDEGTFYSGYDGATRIGSISDYDFSYEGVTYRVKAIVRVGNRVRLEFLDPAFRTAGSHKNRTFYLNIGDSTSLDFRDEDSDTATTWRGVRRDWTGQTYDWTDGQEISVSITTKYLDGSLSLPSDGTSGKLGIFDDPDNDGTGQWERICDDEWDNTNAEVACSQLGLSGGTATSEQGASLSIAETFLLDDVDCDGTEDRVIDCEHAGRNMHDCAAQETAGVICTSP